MRFASILIAVCMVVVAGSIGVTAYLMLTFTAIEAAATALTVLSLLAAYSAFSGRAHDRAEAARQISELSRGTTELAHQVGELGRRVVAIENAAPAPAPASAPSELLMTEIEMLGTLVRQLAESVAAHDAALFDSPQPVHAAPMAPVAPVAPPAVRSEPVARREPMAEPAPAPRLSAAAPFEFLPGEDQAPESFGEIQSALEHNRVDLYLQPIVTLPQRKIKHYEASLRLRTEDGLLLASADYRDAAEAAGLAPMLDDVMLLRSAQVVRRLTGKNRDLAVFCELSGSSLANADIFAQLLDFLSVNRPLAPALALQFSQDTVRQMGPVERDSLAQIAALGFRFALDCVSDLQIEPRPLVELGFRFVRAPAALLLDPMIAATADIHASDFANLLARYGIDLIATQIEAEGTVADLLDYDVRFAQGVLFAQARPVRPEVFQVAPERPQAAASPVRPPQVEPGAREAEAARPVRRREPDLSVPPPPAGERTPQGLVRIARTIMRRA